MFQELRLVRPPVTLKAGPDKKKQMASEGLVGCISNSSLCGRDICFPRVQAARQHQISIWNVENKCGNKQINSCFSLVNLVCKRRWFCSRNAFWTPRFSSHSLHAMNTRQYHEKYQQASYNHSRTLNPSKIGVFGINRGFVPYFFIFAAHLWFAHAQKRYRLKSRLGRRARWHVRSF